MTRQYDIFRERFDGAFVWVEAVQDIQQARNRLNTLLSSEPANYRVWDSSLHKFVNPLRECAKEHFDEITCASHVLQ